MSKTLQYNNNTRVYRMIACVTFPFVQLKQLQGALIAILFIRAYLKSMEIVYA